MIKKIKKINSVSDKNNSLLKEFEKVRELNNDLRGDEKNIKNDQTEKIQLENG